MSADVFEAIVEHRIHRRVETLGLNVDSVDLVGNDCTIFLDEIQDDEIRRDVEWTIETEFDVGLVEVVFVKTSPESSK